MWKLLMTRWDITLDAPHIYCCLILLYYSGSIQYCPLMMWCDPRESEAWRRRRRKRRMLLWITFTRWWPMTSWRGPFKDQSEIALFPFKSSCIARRIDARAWRVMSQSVSIDGWYSDAMCWTPPQTRGDGPGLTALAPHAVTHLTEVRTDACNDDDDDDDDSQRSQDAFKNARRTRPEWTALRTHS